MGLTRRSTRIAARRGGFALACALWIGACAPADRGSSDPGSGDLAPGADAPAAGDFVERGPLPPVGDPRGGDATQIASLLVAPADGGERLVVGFARPDGLPADRVGPVRAEVLRERGVVRLTLPLQVVSAAIVDNHFGTFLADRAFVVRPLAGDSLHLDLHLRSPALVRVRALERPALVLVELRAGGDPLPRSAPAAQRVVVLSPVPGAARYPLTIEGYARTFEANVIAELRGRRGEPARTRTTAADYLAAWGEFRMRIERGPTGPVELFVGEHSAADGAEQGVRIELEIEPPSP